MDPHSARARQEPFFSLKEIHVISWLICIAGIAVVCLMWLRWQRQGGRPEQLLGPDHAAFYLAGRILNEYPPDRIYDNDLHKRLYAELRPGVPWGLPYTYPPFIALMFSLFAGQSFPVAYLIWFSITLALYLGGLWLLIRRFGPLEPIRQSLIVCFCLSYYPFLLETLYNGQLAAIGFFAFALMLHEEDSGRPFMSGLALSLCLYKPTLLILVLPYVLFSRRFRMLFGFCAGASVLFFGTTAILGVRVWQGFIGKLLYFADGATGGTQVFSTWKYLDLNAFWRLALGGRSRLGLALLALCVSVAVWWLLQAWRNASRSASREARLLGWATTLTWTLLLNVYAPIYDSILIIPSLLLTALAVGKSAERRMGMFFAMIWPPFLIVPWFTQPVAESYGLQIMTLLLAAAGCFQFAALRVLLRSADFTSVTEPESTLPA